MEHVVREVGAALGDDDAEHARAHRDQPEQLVEARVRRLEAFDRGDKFTYYKSIETFTEYILIAVNRPYVTQFIKQNELEWLQREAVGLEGKIFSPTFNVEILLSEIYLDVEFPEPMSDCLPGEENGLDEFHRCSFQVGI